jgi:hypothetical protein
MSHHRRPIARHLARKKRRLVVENLEQRSLLAADCYTNFAIPEDTDGSGDVTPLDVLTVVNSLNADTTPVSNARRNPAMHMVDVDADGTSSPLDALSLINFINQSSFSNTPRPSQTDVQRRIGRIEQSIASGDLPPNFTLDDAFDVLATLRVGGRPEMGDRVVYGRLSRMGGPTLNPSTNSNVSNPDGSDDAESTADDSSDDSATDDSIDSTFAPDQIWISRILNRLVASGVSEDQIRAVQSALLTFDSSLENPPNWEDIRSWVDGVFSDLGIDPGTIFPDHEPAYSEEWLTGLQDRLMEAGVSDEVIAALAADVRGAIASGTPWTFQQVKDRLNSLGVDWKSLFRQENADTDPSFSTDPSTEDPSLEPPVFESPDTFPLDDHEVIDSLIRRLRDAKVSPEILQTISSEIKAAFDLGQPWSLDQIRARLGELGIDANSLLPPNSVPPIHIPSDDPPGDTDIADNTPDFSADLFGRIDLQRFLPSLVNRGVSPQIIETVLNEILVARAKGQSLTPSEIVLRLRQLGVSLDRILRPFA